MIKTQQIKETSLNITKATSDKPPANIMHKVQSSSSKIRNETKAPTATMPSRPEHMGWKKK